MGEHWVLFRSTRGWAVVAETCPHRLAPLTEAQVVNGRLQCAYHGWCFDGTGTCVSIPAIGDRAAVPPTAAVAAPHAMTERHGLIWMAVDDPVSDIPVLDEWDDARFGRALMAPQTWNASAGQIADSFLDVTHRPFFRRTTMGDADDREVRPYSVEWDTGPTSAPHGWRFWLTHTPSSRRSTDATSSATDDAMLFEPTMTVVCDAPHHVRLRIADGDSGDLVLAFFLQPVDDQTTTLFCRILAERSADGRTALADRVAVLERVLAEDRALLETLRVAGVPLDPGVEIHTRADRTAVELRRLLADVDALGREEAPEAEAAGPVSSAGGGRSGAIHRVITPSDIGPPAANYAHARLSTGARRSLHTSGVVPIAPDGSVPDDLVEQAEVIWANIKAMLRDAGLTPADIVSVVTYVTPGLDLGPVMAVRDRALDGALAASTLLVVPELARPEWLMEIAIVAEGR
jgi:vanillate O-demethylase monooxygenase subunit